MVDNLSTWSLLSPLVMTVLVSYAIAWYYRENYDPKYYLRAYIVYTIAFLTTSPVWHIPLILSLGIILLGAVVLIFRNQHYFDK
ncbi:hypothetical protein [Lactococcus petauri]|uniref:hypothetical protein n=1 Tax=Lactococcus petauri TaxID=1940789 RepID=UPI0022E5E36B|nr:hypothetical protein [Lactococcus petauri]